MTAMTAAGGTNEKRNDNLQRLTTKNNIINAFRREL